MVIAAPVSDQLRDDILEGTFPPGERLIELQLTERYAVGRAAIRAALVELDAEGLVQREANRGATVRRISVAEAVEITEARAALEGLGAGLAAQRATDADNDELRALIANRCKDRVPDSLKARVVAALEEARRGEPGGEGGLGGGGRGRGEPGRPQRRAVDPRRIRDAPERGRRGARRRGPPLARRLPHHHRGLAGHARGALLGAAVAGALMRNVKR